MKHLLLTILIFSSFLMGNRAAGGGSDLYKDAQGAAGRGKIKTAVNLMKKAVEKEPQNAEFLCYLGDMCGVMAQQASIFSKFSWAKKCKSAYLQAVTLNRDSIRARMSLMRFLVLAPGVAGGSDKEGVIQANEVMKLSSVMGSFSHAFIASRDKDFDKAIQYISEASRLAENCEEFGIRWNRRFALKVIQNTGHQLGKKKKFYKSDKLFSLGLSLFPQEFSLHHYIAVVEERKGDKKRALFHMKKAVELNKKRNLKEEKYFEFDFAAFNRLKKEVEG